MPEKSEGKDLIRENHSSALGAHKGVIKTYNRMRQRYYWEKMKDQIQIFIQNCLDYQLKKLVKVKGKLPMILTDTPGAAFDKVAMDIVGSLPQTPKGNKYVLTIQDQLTKFSLAAPLANITSVDIAGALISHLISKFGATRSVLTDRGTNLLNALIKTIACKFRIRQYKTMAF